jgi:putative tryptophan/tyrosine transport system substrate-binding protein
MRRAWIACLGLALILAPMASSPAALAQTEGKVYRLGLLAETEQSVQITRQYTVSELETLGFAEGRNLVVDPRSGDANALVDLARDLVARKPDAIIAIGVLAVRAARETTSTVPIVIFADDPVGQGWAVSLARPGGNITGITNLVAELDGKRLQLLHEAVPSARRMGALLHAAAVSRPVSERGMRAAAAGSGLELVIVEASGPDDYADAFVRLRGANVQGLVVGPNPTFFRDAERLAALALEAKLPTICEWADMAQSGCLLGFGPNRPQLRRRLAHTVARLFRGAVPGELPIEGPTHFEFAVNQKTARALGLDLPGTILLRADEVIE